MDKIGKQAEGIEKEIGKIRNKIKHEKSGFQLKDLIQEIAGAILLAFPFAANADIWEISQKMSYLHTVILLILIILGLFIVIKYGKLENWKTQNIAGILPLRLITILAISLIVSALSLLILGIYPSIITNLNWFLKTTVLITLFSVMGSFGVDAAK